jgi:FkbM family methyltransferase
VRPGQPASVPKPARLRLAQMLCGLTPPAGVGKVQRLVYPYERGQQDHYPFAVRARTGSTFRGNTADFHGHPFAVGGSGDWRNWAVAVALCGPGDLIVEVGANVGTETVGFSDIVGGEGRVMSFEPSPGNLTALEAMASGLRHANVELLPYALSDHAGSDTFAVPPESMSQGIGHLLGPVERTTGTAIYYDDPVDMSVIEVECRTLDEFANDLRGVRLLVADAEGAEIAILRGGRDVLLAERPALVLEASQPHQHRAGFGLEELHEELLALGYRPFVLAGLGADAVSDPQDAPEHSNWLCMPEDRLQLVTRVRRYLRRCALMPCVLGLNPLTSPRRG